MKNQEQKTILLVEDDTIAAMIETHLLKSFGYDVVIVKSGEEAVQIATGNGKIALILMDINLGPGIDGTEAAKQILGKRHLPIVFLTAHTEEKYVERVKAITRYGYVLKASDKFVLQSSIEMAFELFEVVETLRESEERLDMAQSAAKAGVWDWDVVTGHIKWSAQMFDLFGLDPLRNILSFELWKSVIHPEDMEIAGLRMDQALKQQTILNTDYRVVLPDGQIRWINAVGQGKYGDQGRPVRMIGICMDITERKKAEEALEKACAELEDKVEKRTKELQERLNELERFRKATVDREFRMKELCDEIERLKAEKK